MQMKLTEMQKELMKELKEQGANKDIVDLTMLALKTESQQKEMMDYLISIRKKTVNKNTVFLKAIEIKNKNQI